MSSVEKKKTIEEIFSFHKVRTENQLMKSVLGLKQGLFWCNLAHIILSEVRKRVG